MLNKHCPTLTDNHNINQMFTVCLTVKFCTIYLFFSVGQTILFYFFVSFIHLRTFDSHAPIYCIHHSLKRTRNTLRGTSHRAVRSVLNLRR